MTTKLFPPAISTAVSIKYGPFAQLIDDKSPLVTNPFPISRFTKPFALVIVEKDSEYTVTPPIDPCWILI